MILTASTTMKSFINTHNDTLFTLSQSTCCTLENCPIFSDYDESMIDLFGFWVQGVLLCCVALLGFIGNSFTIYMICQQEEKHTFNLLLVWMLCFNNCYLFGSVIERFRKHFDLETYAHQILFPQVLYPAQNIFMSASIYLTCGITIERYIAVYYPINYNKSVATSSSSKCRLIKYVIPIVALSILINVPKFFEAKVSYKRQFDSYEGSQGVNDDQILKSIEDTGDGNDQILVPYIHATGIRKNEHYSIYYNSWGRLIFLGIFPTFLLIFFNFKIYKEIKGRQTRTNSNRYF